MLSRLLISAFLLISGFALPAFAQNTFVQIEAKPDLQGAQQRARAWSDDVFNVNGFRMRSGWYAIALGPFTAEQAESEMRSLKNTGRIPRDSYITNSVDYSQQFWPTGATALTSPQAVETPVPVEQVETVLEATPVAPDETPREARRSESNLTRDEKKDLQIALQWDGFYNSTIDGSFGRGTRASMAAWQEANNHEATGVLTTAQRAQLIDSYNAVLAGIGMASHTDAAAGITLDIPAALVTRSREEYPFVQFDAKDDSDVRMLLISQAGTQATLHGLYDIMQTLEIVPTEGPRSKDANSFTLVGENSTFISHTEARFANGEVKGFTLVWPLNDERRRLRVLSAMQDSFIPLQGTTLPLSDPGSDQSIDLLAGLEIRKPTLSRSGFFISDNGTVLTTSEVTGQCSEITLNHDTIAEVIFSDDTLGVAALRPVSSIAPAAVAGLRDGAARIQSDVIVAGFPFEGVLPAATLTWGRLEDIRGLNGEENLQRLAMLAEPGDAGGPVFDASGAVIGLLNPATSPEGQRLPEIVRFATRSSALVDLLFANGLSASAPVSSGAIAPEELTILAADTTVLVSCWN
ncbi:trypsin-like peptidase domain-containing protein [Halocynthiibacter styelae]|uniref:Trypsin-like peptidase domain-containing protein n=1 Tax=Halocynthiibacter styelae TaxID=2761955 RepID=A0A8J7IZ15_9RHOB|nr:trypsin-like peptidase domain-containing protein [Paenihalocynthiibacter styelae]MBI1494935.1 trypsin-like peptidase domain-containing protein [Paenihalocynthiibacter styelae]